RRAARVLADVTVHRGDRARDGCAQRRLRERQLGGLQVDLRLLHARLALGDRAGLRRRLRDLDPGDRRLRAQLLRADRGLGVLERLLVLEEARRLAVLRVREGVLARDDRLL